MTWQNHVKMQGISLVSTSGTGHKITPPLICGFLWILKCFIQIYFAVFLPNNKSQVQKITPPFICGFFWILKCFIQIYFALFLPNNISQVQKITPPFICGILHGQLFCDHRMTQTWFLNFTQEACSFGRICRRYKRCVAKVDPGNDL